MDKSLQTETRQINERIYQKLAIEEHKRFYMLPGENEHLCNLLRDTSDVLLKNIRDRQSTVIMSENIEKVIANLLELRHTCFPSHPKCREDQFKIVRIFSSAFPGKEHWRFVSAHTVPACMSDIQDFESYESARIYLAQFIAAVIEHDCQTFLSTPSDELPLIPGGIAHWHKVLNELVGLQRSLLAEVHV